MIRHTANQEKLNPVLPNLVMTTDEVTIFATTEVVNNKESFYLVAQPEELKDKSCRSGARNQYKNKPTGNTHCRGIKILMQF